MAKPRYKSQYSPGKYITGAQYILEIVCEKKATFDKTVLPIKFWNLPQWKTFFARNLRRVHKLLKSFDEVAVIRALSHYQFKDRYSIFTDFFECLVQQEQVKIITESKKETIHTPLNRDTIDSKVRPRLVKKNLLTRLDENE